MSLCLGPGSVGPEGRPGLEAARGYLLLSRGVSVMAEPLASGSGHRLVREPRLLLLGTHPSGRGAASGSLGPWLPGGRLLWLWVLPSI